MQYFKPAGNFFVGDCMPFYDGKIFHLYYLLDEGHHQGRNGLGNHQWAHATSTDLIHWQHHPLAITITEEWEASICTGSVFQYQDTFYAFYAVRKWDWSQQLNYAVSKDGYHFTKAEPSPLLTAPAGYLAADFRDPFVFIDNNNRFRMFLTSRIANYPLYQRGGCILGMSSDDLMQWQTDGTIYLCGGQAGEACVPECPDLFYWNGWYYLLFGADHKTSYVMSRDLAGPWQRPLIEDLGTSWMLSVMKTAPFGDNRRIGVGWVGCRSNDLDTGQMLWGGNAVFRELKQLEDGTLGTCFPPEMLPATDKELTPGFRSLTTGVTNTAGNILLESSLTETVVALTGIPHNFYLRCKIQAKPGTYRFGLGIRGAGNYQSFYTLAFMVPKRTIQLEGEVVAYPAALDEPFTLELIAKDDIIDVCIGQQQCIINRLGQLQGDQLFCFCEFGTVTFKELMISPIDS